MANALYDAGKDALGTAQINWVSDDIRVVLIDSADYTADLAAHTSLDDIPAAARVATMSASLSGKSVTAGAFHADNPAFTSVTGDTAEVLVLYKHTGNEATSTLLVFMDTAVSGLPVTPNSGPINIQWNGGPPANIFRI